MYRRLQNTFPLLLALSWLFVLSSCDSGSEDPSFSATPYALPQPKFFPSKLNIPEDNPMTVEGVELGRFLFYDGRLSGSDHPDSLMSCGTCHVQQSAFDTGFDHPIFKDGQPRALPLSSYPNGDKTPHYTLSLTNLVFQSQGYLWNGLIHESNENLGSERFGVPAVPEFHSRNIESFVWHSIHDPNEIKGNVPKTVKKIASDPMYGPMFKSAFGTEEINYDRISKAIAQFVRSIVSSESKYHQYLRGEAELNDEEVRGLNLFFSEEADCFHCHGGTVLMSNLDYFNNAKDSVFTDEMDRFAVTGEPLDIGAYKAPTLLNIELTGPYMQDGRFTTLDEVIDFYSEGLVYSEYAHPLMKYVRDGGTQMTAEQKSDLKAFLLTLTDHSLVDDPKYACPEEVEQYYPIKAMME